MDYHELKKRIAGMNYTQFNEMTLNSMLRLTDVFKEPLVRCIIARAPKHQQKYLLSVVESFFIRTCTGPYPEYFNELQFDIDTGVLITADDESSAEEKPATDELTDSDAIKNRMDELAEEYYRLKEKLGENDEEEEDEDEEEEDEEDEEEEDDAEYWKDELNAYKERQQSRAGINRLQTAHLGLKLAPKLGIYVTNKKELAPVLSKLFGWGENSMEKRLCEYLPEEQEMELANIFGELSPELAKYICDKWEGTPTPEDGAPPEE